ncbi:MAG: glutamine-hydrolyzing carbamoyl-phosphate synthase small subunit [Phycisphaerales bacterium]
MAEPASPPSARLALEDGAVFHGRAFGCTTARRSAGEVVFNTAMCGYQEALTDPSYSGQILVMTAPMIGNYGVGPDDLESPRPQVAGFVVRELSHIRSNHRSDRGLSEWLAEQGIAAIEGIDTRALVRRLRSTGAMRGVLSVGERLTDAELVASARAIPRMNGQNLAACVSPQRSGAWRETLGEWSPRSRGGAGAGDKPSIKSGGEAGAPREAGAARRAVRVLALDCGAKRNIYRNLADVGCEVEFVPHDLPAEEIRRRRPDGLFISNGPGDPAAVTATVATLREVAGETPTFGICLGHQLLALALGASTYKLKFGHRGANQPVRNLLTGRVEITSQNHGFCVEEASLRAVGGEPTHVHLNDGTLAGFRHATKPIFSVQYHPEAAPGPHDSAYLFDCFVEIMRTRTPVDAETMRRAQDARASARAGG